MNDNKTSTRKLSAILFADIVGYTALMQSDEVKGNQYLEKFHQTLKTKVNLNNGEVINNYGDGCVCTFGSAVEAMNCAKEVQTIFQSTPKVPVRIGLHSGDVFFKDNNVYGDSVNIASRIESLGIAGAILFSKRIKRHISNQPDFQIQSLGEFDFKNVNKSMEVFALANQGFVIPQPKEMKGKLKETNKKSTWWPVGLLILSLVALGAYFFNNANSDLLPNEIRNARIAVLPFENKTNDPNLEITGTMAADWITEGLMNLKDVKVVSFNNIRSNLKFASFGEGATPNSDFQKLTGAEKIIKGNYYKINGQLIFKSQIIDATTGELELTLKDIEGSEKDISQIVNTLKSRIMGYFVSKEEYLKRNPPKYEAYMAYNKALDHFGVDHQKSYEQLVKAMRIDSNFISPIMFLITTNTIMGDYGTADSIFSILKNRYPDPPRVEQLWYDWVDATIHRDLNKQREAINQLHTLDPKDFKNNFLAAHVESNLNYPAAAISIYEEIDTSVIRKIMTTPYQTWWYTMYAYNLARMKRYDEAQQILDMVPEKFANFESENLMLKAKIDVLNNEGKGLQNLIKQLEENKVPASMIADLYRSVAITNSLLGDEEQQNEWATNGIAYLKNQPEGSQADLFNLAEFYYLSAQYELAISTYNQLYQNSTTGSIFGIGNWHHLSRIGTSYARMGDKNKALEKIEALQNIKDPTPSGRFTYGIARIYAQLGDHEKAMQYLTEALEEGFINSSSEFRYAKDVDFLPLKGKEEFENFVLQKR